MNIDWSFLFYDCSLLTIFLAPVAHGKTRMVSQLMEAKKGRWIYVSPLKALAREVQERNLKTLPTIFFERKRKTELLRSMDKKRNFLLILTEHQFDEEIIGWIGRQEIRPIIVWDEFHLIEYWGHDFRPALWEMFTALAGTGSTILGLTATLDLSLIEKVKREYVLGFDRVAIIDNGNFQLRFRPSKIHRYFPHHGKYLQRAFLKEMRRRRKLKRRNHMKFQIGRDDKTLLYFCKTRRQVDFQQSFFSRFGVVALSCKGGEVEQFQEQLKSTPRPDCIFATTCLGHGVNLPPIGQVYLSYEIGNQDFWLQMAGRGGRDGSPYDVYTLDEFEKGRFKYFCQKVWNCIRSFF